MTPSEFVHARIKSRRGEANNGRPLGHSATNAVQHEDVTCAPIVCLRDDGSPIAIIWRIRAVVIGAVNRMPRRWPSPHVGKEVFEAISPTVAHYNAASTVTSKGFILSVVASGLHRTPHDRLAALRQAMRWLAGANTRRTTAATAFTTPSQQPMFLGQRMITARASTMEGHVGPSLAVDRQHGQLAVSQPNHVYGVHVLSLALHDGRMPVWR